MVLIMWTSVCQVEPYGQLVMWGHQVRQNVAITMLGEKQSRKARIPMILIDGLIQTKKVCLTYLILTKYCDNEKYGVVDNKYTLEASDDAATATWRKKWRMPTYEEQRELIDNCTWKYVKNYKGSDVSGYLGTSKKNKKTFFLPCCGHYGRSGFEEAISGFYWSKVKGRNNSLM